MLDPRDRLISRRSSPEEAARAWCRSSGQVFEASEDNADIQVSDGRFDWNYRFLADGDGMKSAGVTLPGRICLMTWLK